MSTLDHRMTEQLRAYGAAHLAFWKIVASKGMWLFVVVWIGVVVLGWMPWWRPIVPLALSYVTLLIVQAVVRRERPNFEQLSGYRMWIRTYSFPSGHSTESTVLALSLILFPVYPFFSFFIFATVFLAILAILVMYSRIAVGVHYVGDVFAGAALGILYVIAFL